MPTLQGVSNVDLAQVQAFITAVVGVRRECATEFARAYHSTVRVLVPAMSPEAIAELRDTAAAMAPDLRLAYRPITRGMSIVAYSTEIHANLADIGQLMEAWADIATDELVRQSWVDADVAAALGMGGIDLSRTFERGID